MRATYPKPLPTDFSYRFLYSILFLVIFLPILFIGYYFVFWGRIVSFIFLNLFLFYSLFEIFSHFQVKKFFAVLLSFFGVFLFSVPAKKEIIDINFSPETNFDWNLVLYLIKNQFLDYHIFFILALTVVISFFDDKIEKKHKFLIGSLLKFSIIYVASFFFRFLWILNTFNIFLVIFLISIAIISDTFGYIFGLILGKKFFKKNFNFSPNKSIEGFIFSFVFSSILVFLVLLNLDLNIKISAYLPFKILSIFLLPLGSITGDAFFSVVKRYLKIKDFSQIIKCHGGLFDRFDSISFVFLTFSIIIITTA
ncbi:phosphatidate cytidylyltransferase [Mycoplasma flocculare]|uniref:Phosphatidate cytidylyltransferase n=1 Tax=Mesomycoplasma flocculare TaxID=2128 RepID=A0AAW9XB35_MESFC|nr:phosphatidate cytidylyltransferase [Mesomycoplasma flocculare]MXR12118.1 phosphatidate cytidylyltransferase [Mesomycoplasma flocculare]MXR56477.1 phosphatidate cytidylyltransferase [Mesomycoplasma flocculare]